MAAASIALHAVVFPSFDAVESQDPSAAAAIQSIRTALEKAEAANPSLTHELVDAILESEQAKGATESTEKLLRIAAQDIEDYRIPEKTPELKTLVERSNELKKMLSTIPEEISNRTKFLAIIRDIAAAIKALLEAVNAVAENNATLLASQKQPLDEKKKVFVRGSKSFSNTLKQYFKDNRKDAVFRSAHRLINQTNMVLRTIRLAVVDK